MDLEIKMTTFYKIGVGCFSVIFLMGFLNFFIRFSLTNIFDKISTIGSLTFNVALILVFRTLLKQNKVDESSSSDLKELVEDFTNAQNVS